MEPFDDDEHAFAGTLVTDVLSGRPCLRQLRVSVTRGPDKGAEHALGPSTVLVGSGRDAEFKLTDPRVSRRHVEVVATDDGVRVRDLGSKNGTTVGGARVDEAVLAPGGKFRIGGTTLSVEAVDAPWDLGAGDEAFGALSTRSARMRATFGLLNRAARSEVTILLEGETGVGKEVFARTIHEESARSAGPFIVFDCGSVSSSLIASELFGHKKGAFTGAISDRVGVFEAAQGGTVFLDEIGELALELQPSLLRALESRQVRRVGETVSRPIDVRIIAATNRRLSDEVDAGRFRGDLLYRLAVVRCQLPPLRERKEDVPLLAEALLAELGQPAHALDSADLRRLVRHDWPGNVRELRNVLEQSSALSAGALELIMPEGASAQAAPGPALVEREPTVDDITADAPESGAHIPIDDLLTLSYREARDAALARFETAYFTAGLARHDGNVSRLAAAAGIARNYAHRLMRRNGIRRRYTV